MKYRIIWHDCEDRTLSFNPTCEKLARIVTEDEKYLHQVKGGNQNG